MLGGLLPLEDGLDGEVRPFPDRHRVGGGDHPSLAQASVARISTSSQAPEPGLVGEEGGDLRQCVALYQGGPSSCRTLYEPGTVRTDPDSGAPASEIGAKPSGEEVDRG